MCPQDLNRVIFFQEGRGIYQKKIWGEEKVIILIKDSLEGIGILRYNQVIPSKQQEIF